MSRASALDRAPALPPRRRRLPRPLRLVGLAFGILGGAVVLGGCRLPTFFAYRGATAQGQDEFKLWVGLFIAGLVVAGITWGLIFWSVAFYRRKNDEIPKQFHHHVPLEIIYTTLPLIIVGVIFAFTVVTENEVDAISSHPNEIIGVLAYRWGWRFTYNDGHGHPQGVLIQTTGEPTGAVEAATSPLYPQLVLPEHETIRIVLNSQDVVHSFYIPAFNFQRYAQPGVVNSFDFTTTTAGVFDAQCAEYCGLYHSQMLFSVRVEPPAAFDQWLVSHQGSTT